MGLFNHHSDSVMFDNPCPPGCETCCPLDIQLTFDPITNILTLTYIYDDATVVRTVDLSHDFDLELILNGTILELTGEHDETQVFTSVDLAPIIPVLPVGLFYSEDNITYYDVSGTLQLTEYIIVVSTDLLTLTLPATPVLGQMYKVYCTVPGTTVNGNVGQTISGSGTSVSMILGDGMIFQYIKTNQWGVINL
jgi:hypothetical protein